MESFGDGSSIVRGSGVRSDGRRASLTAPNGSAQVHLLDGAFGSGAVASPDLLEAHGTGTALGDPTEVAAIERAFGRSAASIAAGKANVGHTEPAAGMLGLFKLLVALGARSGSVNAQLRSLNPLLAQPLRDGSLLVATQAHPLHQELGTCGVSSFGYSGTIAHMVLQLSKGQLRLQSTHRTIKLRRLCYPWPGMPSGPKIRSKRQMAQPDSILADGTVLSRAHLSPAVGAALLQIGSSNTRTRGRDVGDRVRLGIESETGVAVLEFNDPQRYNTLSLAFGDDVHRAVCYLQSTRCARGLSLQGAGSTFCAGGNPYGWRATQLISLARDLYESIRGFIELGGLNIPIVAAVHGTMIGGAAAIFLHADLRFADRDATFQHGNLSRGVCPIAGYSHTLKAAVGIQHALEYYLTDRRLSADEALAFGLVQEVISGIEETQTRARQAVGLLSTKASRRCMNATCNTRCEVNELRIATEVVAHAECLQTNHGMLKAEQLATGSGSDVRQLNLTWHRHEPHPPSRSASGATPTGMDWPVSVLDLAAADPRCV